jgi:cytochrome c6
MSVIRGEKGERVVNRLRSPGRALTVMAVSVVLAAGALSTASATGSGASSRAPNGRKLFIASCGSCHTLRAAGATGTDGPNLDRLYRHTKRSTIKGRVGRAIRNGVGGMPAGILAGGDADAVAAYVASVTGKPPPRPKRKH